MKRKANTPQLAAIEIALSSEFVRFYFNQYGGFLISALASGEQKDFTYTLPLPEFLEGYDVTILALVDGGDSVVESNEQNNRANAFFMVVPPPCTQQTFYRDADGDGQGNNAVTRQACTAPIGFVSDNRDCDDTNNAIKAGAPEVCNGKDDDCNGLVDDGLVPPMQTCTVGVGACAKTGTQAETCQDTNGWSAFGTCSATPGTPQQGPCNDGIDNDCDGKIDQQDPDCALTPQCIQAKQSFTNTLKALNLAQQQYNKAVKEQKDIEAFHVQLSRKARVRNYKYVVAAQQRTQQAEQKKNQGLTVFNQLTTAQQATCTPRTEQLPN